MPLGLIYDENGDIANHRSVLKVICNPLLRIAGLNIATVVENDGSISGLELVSCSKIELVDAIHSMFAFKLPPRWFVLKKRLII